MITQITNDSLEQNMAQQYPIQVIEFYRKSCAHCMMLQKELEELSEETDSDVTFGKVDIEEEPFISQKFDIMSVPTVLFLKNGELKEKLIGFYPKIMFKETIKKLR